MTHKEYLEILPADISFVSIQPMFYNVLNQYPELDIKVWALLSWYERFMSSSKMASIVVDDERYFLVRTDAIIAVMWMFGLKERHAVGKLLDSLCGVDGEEGKLYFLKKHAHKDRYGTATYYAPTEMLFALFHKADGIKAINEEYARAEPEPIDAWVPSENLITFRDKVYATCSKYSGKGEFFDKEKPVKYWVTMDSYLTALLDGTFISTYGQKFTKKVNDFSDLTMDQIIDAAINCISPSGKAPVNQVFVPFQAKYSPIHNYLEKKLGKPSGEPKKIRASSYDLTNQQKRHLDVIFGYATDAFGYASKDVRAGLTVDKTVLYNFGSRVAEFIEDNKEQLLAQNPCKSGYIDLSNYCKYLCEFIIFHNKENAWKDESYQNNQKLTMDRVIMEMKVGNNDNPLWAEFTVYCKENQGTSVAMNKSVYNKIEKKAQRDCIITLPTEKEIKQALYEEGLDN